jgi:hypothetical protein
MRVRKFLLLTTTITRRRNQNMGAMPAYIFEVIESSKRDSAQEYFFELERTLMSEDTQSKSIGEVEEEIYTKILELGRRLIQEHVDARGDGHVGEALCREDGKRLSHKRLGTRHLETLFGEVEVERMGYSDRGESSIFPKDRQMALPEKVYSYPVQQKGCREAIRGSYDEIDETLSEYTGAHVPKRQSLEIVKQAPRQILMRSIRNVHLRSTLEAGVRSKLLTVPERS